MRTIPILTETVNLYCVVFLSMRTTTAALQNNQTIRIQVYGESSKDTRYGSPVVQDVR